MADLIYRQIAIDAIKTWGLIDGLSEGQAIEILSDENKVPSARPEQSIAIWQKDFREYINMLNIPKDDYNGIMEYIDEVPSAQSEHKTGHWVKSDIQRWYDVWLCSECGEKTDSAVMSKPRYKYCPMCGAKMREE